MDSSLDRDALRARLRIWRGVQRRLFVERAVEHLPDDLLEQLLARLVLLEPLRRSAESGPPTLLERVTAHVDATRRGEYLGDFVVRNLPGQREPWQTRAWVAATALLFELALDGARGEPEPEPGALASLRLLVDLVREVDARVDELVEFEESNACLELGHDVEKARPYL